MSVRNAISTKSAAAGSAVFAAAMGFAVMASPAMAQAQAPASGQAPQGWYKACTQQAENDVCVVQNIVAAGNGQLLTAVGLISVEGQVNQRVMQVSVPSARLVQPGINMQIDGGQATKLDFAVCMPDKCVAEVPLTDAMVAEFKRGGEVVFTSVNFQRAPNPISISLSGFTQAFDGEAMAQSELEERQRVLQEEMQRKAAEARQRLEEAQEAAKSN
jgi:invasion protein IalB